MKRLRDAWASFRRPLKSPALTVAELAERSGVGLVLVCGEQRAGGGVGWLTGWPVTAEAIAVIQAARTPVLFIQHYNHVPLARRIAAQCEVRWGGASTIEALDAERPKRSPKKIGILLCAGAIPIGAPRS